MKSGCVSVRAARRIHIKLSSAQERILLFVLQELILLCSEITSELLEAPAVRAFFGEPSAGLSTPRAQEVKMHDSKNCQMIRFEKRQTIKD